MQILQGSEIDRAEWSRLVGTSTTGTWFQTPEAFLFFASQKDLFRPFAVALAELADSGGRQVIRGVCVGYVTHERSALKQFFTRRAVVLGGPCLADDCTEEEAQMLMQAVLGHARGSDGGYGMSDTPIFFETRNFNDYSRWRRAFEKAGWKYQPHLNFHVDCTDKEAVWERMNENRRRQIRRGREEGVVTPRNEEVTEPDIRGWYQILAELYRTKVKTPLWPVDFFIEAYRQGIGRFMMVKHGGRIIGGSMLVTDGKTVYEWFECGLNAEYKEQYPSVAATYAGMMYAHEQGCARYDMMGAGVPDIPYGVRDFKSAFGGAMVEHGRYLMVNKKWLYRLGKWGVKMLRHEI